MSSLILLFFVFAASVFVNSLASGSDICDSHLHVPVRMAGPQKSQPTTNNNKKHETTHHSIRQPSRTSVCIAVYSAKAIRYIIINRARQIFRRKAGFQSIFYPFPYVSRIGFSKYKVCFERCARSKKLSFNAQPEENANAAAKLLNSTLSELNSKNTGRQTDIEVKWAIESATDKRRITTYFTVHDSSSTVNAMSRFVHVPTTCSSWKCAVKITVWSKELISKRIINRALNKLMTHPQMRDIFNKDMKRKARSGATHTRVAGYRNKYEVRLPYTRKYVEHHLSI